MSELTQRYKDDGIWTGETSRTSCVVPESPLMLTSNEEYEYNELTLAVWKALESVVQLSSSSTVNAVQNGAKPFPDGPTMPPAIRIDTVRTPDGPKIVEIDPV